MNVRIEKSRLQGEVCAPPSKSVAHRLLLAAALAKGKSTIDNVALSADILATVSCIKSLGAQVNTDTADKKPQRVEVYGTGGDLRVGGEFFCNESGSTLRFLLPLSLCALCRRNEISGGNNAPDKAVFCGAPRLIQRGVSIYEEIFPNARFKKEITSCGAKITVSGEIRPGKYAVRGNISSQFITGLFYALPLLYGNSEVEILPPFESASYISLTLSVLQKAGIIIEKTAENLYFIRGNQRFKNGDFFVEGDWSNAAFLYALNTLGGNITVRGTNEKSAQGDKICRRLLTYLSQRKLQADLSDCPDLAPVLFAVAAAKHGAYFTGTRRLKIKESDRAECMKQELEKFGARVIVNENSAEIIPAAPLVSPAVPLSSHGDHRIAMALSLLCLITGGEITGAEAVNKSYPNFYDDLRASGARITFFETP